MAKTLFKPGSYTDTFREEVAGQLVDSPWVGVEPGATPGTVKLLATPANIIGVVWQRDVQENQDHTGTEVALNVTVLFIKSLSQIKATCNAAIPYLGYVKYEAGGNIGAGTAGDNHGRNMGPDAAAGDIITIQLANS